MELDPDRGEAAVQLALTTEEAAFRDELRGIYTTQIPAELRELVREGSSISGNNWSRVTRS